MKAYEGMGQDFRKQKHQKQMLIVSLLPGLGKIIPCQANETGLRDHISDQALWHNQKRADRGHISNLCVFSGS